MKKIALILPTKPEDGGEHQYALLVANSLLSGVNIDYELIVLCGNSFWKKWCKKSGIEYLGCSLPSFSMEEKLFHFKHPLLAKIYYSHMTSLGKTIREKKVNILFCLQQGIFIPDYGVRFICPVHDLMHRYESRFPEVAAGYEAREIYMKCLSKYADVIMVDSRLGRKQFRESYMRLYQKRPYIFRFPYIAGKCASNIEEEYIKVPDKYIFYPAQFWKHKNHINLIKAIGILSESIKDIHLVLVGSEKNSYSVAKKYIKENGLDHYITIMGFVSDGAVRYLYRHAVGMVMPSYFGPTNIPPLEAMALGCPVAVSNKYAMPEQVGDAGLLFNPDSPQEIAECVRKLWTDDGLRKRMIKRGYARTRQWTEEDFRVKLQNLLKLL